MVGRIEAASTSCLIPRTSPRSARNGIAILIGRLCARPLTDALRASPPPHITAQAIGRRQPIKQAPAQRRGGARQIGRECGLRHIGTLHQIRHSEFSIDARAADTDPMNWQALASRAAAAVSTITVALAASGCGRMATASQTTPKVPPAVAAAAKRCRSFGPDSRATLVGQRPSPAGVGPCPSRDLRQIVGLVERLRAAVRGHGAVCSLLTPSYRSKAQRWQGEPPGYPSCDAAVLKISGTVNPKLQFAQPVGSILLFYRKGRAAGLITFSKATATSLPADPRTQPITISTTRISDSTWQIDQIGYEF